MTQVILIGTYGVIIVIQENKIRAVDQFLIRHLFDLYQDLELDVFKAYYVYAKTGRS